MHIDNITSEKMTLDADGKSMQISIYEKNIEQLQQENQQLKQMVNFGGITITNCPNCKKEITVNFCRETENYRKKYLNAVADYEMVMSELQELKKQLEAINEQANYLRKSVERKEETIIDLQNERVPYTNEYVAKLETQQKEFIEYLEKEKDRLASSVSHTYEDSLGKSKLVNEDIFNEVDKNLSKYKEIIGDNK